jgi:adenylate cyclase
MTAVEIPVSLLFSDIRGSTAVGERMRPADFHAFLDRFYRLASNAIVDHHGYRRQSCG